MSALHLLRGYRCVCTSAADRLAIVPMSQEARGLDAGQRLATRLVGAGDNRSASIVNRIAEEERAHVAVGEAHRACAPTGYSVCMCHHVACVCMCVCRCDFSRLLGMSNEHGGCFILHPLVPTTTCTCLHRHAAAESSCADRRLVVLCCPAALLQVSNGLATCVWHWVWTPQLPSGPGCQAWGLNCSKGRSTIRNASW